MGGQSQRDTEREGIVQSGRESVRLCPVQALNWQQWGRFVFFKKKNKQIKLILKKQKKNNNNLLWEKVKKKKGYNVSLISNSKRGVWGLVWGTWYSYRRVHLQSESFNQVRPRVLSHPMPLGPSVCLLSELWPYVALVHPDFTKKCWKCGTCHQNGEMGR